MNALTVVQLRKLASEKNISGRSKMKKADLIAALADIDHAMQNLVLENQTSNEDAFARLPEIMKSQVLANVSPRSLARAIAVSSDMKRSINDPHLMREVAPKGLKHASKIRDVQKILDLISYGLVETHRDEDIVKLPSRADALIDIRIHSGTKASEYYRPNESHREIQRDKDKLSDIRDEIASWDGSYRINVFVDMQSADSVYHLVPANAFEYIRATFDIDGVDPFNHPLLKGVARQGGNIKNKHVRETIKSAKKFDVSWEQRYPDKYDASFSYLHITLGCDGLKSIPIESLMNAFDVTEMHFGFKM